MSKLERMKKAMMYANMTTMKTDEEVYWVIRGFISDMQKIHDQLGVPDKEDLTLKTRCKVLSDLVHLNEKIDEWLDE